MILTHFSIGYLADGNGGCSHLSGSYGHHDDAALGVGLQSRYDANSCYKGGSGHKAGRTRLLMVWMIQVVWPVVCLWSLADNIIFALGLI